MGNTYKFRSYGFVSELDNRFAHKDEVEQALTHIDLRGDLPLNGGGTPIISDTEEAYVDKDDYHMLVLGSTGSMKTRAVILPTILTLAKAKENMVITDPKGEIYQMSSGMLSKMGYDVKVINLRNMSRSDCWNPLEEAYRLYQSGEKERGTNLAVEFIHTLNSSKDSADNPFWYDSGMKAVRAAVKMLLAGSKTPDECSPASISQFYRYYAVTPDGPGDATREMGNFIYGLPKECSIRTDIENILNLTFTTQSGVLSHFSTIVDPFVKSKSLEAISSHSTIDLHAFSSEFKKTALFIITPDEESTFNFYVSLLVKQLYTIAVRDATLNKENRLPHRLNFLLDEFANIPRIPDMSSMITAARSRNIRFFLVVQSDAQLHAKYGDEAEIIKTNCLDWIYLNSKEDSLIRQVSSMIGTTEEGLPLVSYQELGTLKKAWGIHAGAEAIFLMARSRPYLTFLPDISRYTEFENLPPLDFPVTDTHYSLFNPEERIFSLSRRDQIAVYGEKDLKKDEEDSDGDENEDGEEENDPDDDEMEAQWRKFLNGLRQADEEDGYDESDSSASDDSPSSSGDTDGSGGNGDDPDGGMLDSLRKSQEEPSEKAEPDKPEKKKRRPRKNKLDKPFPEDGTAYDVQKLAEDDIIDIYTVTDGDQHYYSVTYSGDITLNLSPDVVISKGYVIK